MDLRLMNVHAALAPKIHAPWVQLTQIEPDIYLGGIPYPKSDEPGSRNMNALETPHAIIDAFNIGLLISFTDTEVVWNVSPAVKRLHYILPDYPQSNIFSCFGDVNEKIEEARSAGKNIFVHCHAGVSRSVTVLTAYYLWKEFRAGKVPRVQTTVKQIQTKRACAWPNLGFLCQLVTYKGLLELDLDEDN